MHLSFNSYYSLRYGTIPVDKLPALALQAGAEAALLTDINNSTGIIDFVRACNKEGVKPIRVMKEQRTKNKKKKTENRKQKTENAAIKSQSLVATIFTPPQPVDTRAAVHQAASPLLAM